MMGEKAQKDVKQPAKSGFFVVRHEVAVLKITSSQRWQLVWLRRL